MRHLFLFLIFSSFVLQGFSQKIKYDDLFILLNAKRYEEAEPFLRKFLRDEKNDDHANSHLQMGNIFYQKEIKADVLAENKNNYADSAIIFYKKALTLIDDREIRKNDEFYEEYLRRDLRTGKVEIKLSDIHFDLQKKIEDLTKRTERVGGLRHYFNKFSSTYTSASSEFTKLSTKFKNERLLLLRGEEEALSVLKNITLLYDSSQFYFTKYRELLDESSDMGYNQLWHEMEITDFSAIDTKVDFKANDIKAYNLGKWAAGVQDVVLNEIIPAKAELLVLHNELEGLRNKIQNDSVSVRAELNSVSEKYTFALLEKHDPKSFPGQLFNLEMGELNFLSSAMEYKNLKDSADLFRQMDFLTAMVGEIAAMDSLLNLLKGYDLNEEVLNYEQYINNSFGSRKGVEEYISRMEGFVTSQDHEYTGILNRINKGLNFMVYEDDSIPLNIEFVDSTLKYLPVKVVEEKFAVGFIVPDHRLSGGFFTDINPSRQSTVKVDIALDTIKQFSSTRLDSTEVLSANDANEQIYYVMFYQPEQDNITYNASISKIYKATGLSWTKSFSWEMKPNSLYYQPDTGNLVVSFNNNVNATVTKEGQLK